MALYGYAGREADASTGLTFMRARYYDPNIGRFTQADPLGFIEGVNQYAYALNNPVNRSDPLGTVSQAFAGTQSSYGASPSPGTMPGSQQSLGSTSLSERLDQFQAYLDLAGLLAQGPLEVVGVPIDLANAGISALRGNYAAAGVSLAASVPVIGVVANAAKNAKNAAKLADEVPEVARRVEVPRSRYPEGAAHIEDAQAAGHPSTLTIDRAGTGANRSAAQAGYTRPSGMDLDEYPPAMFREGGAGASVRPMTPAQNRGMGACIGNQCRALPDGTQVQIIVVD